MAEQAKEAPKGGEGSESANVDLTKFVPKEDVEKISATATKLQDELDKAKMSLLDPDYLAFQEAKRTPKKHEATAKEVDYDNMSPKQIAEHITRTLASEVIAPLAEELNRTKHSVGDVLALLEVQAAEKKYKDFDDYREDIKKIIETSSTDLTIEQAYKIAKADKPAPAPEVTKPKGSEKPGGTKPVSTEPPKKFKSAKEAADAAWDATVGADVDRL